MAKEKIIVLDFDRLDAKVATKWVKKIKEYFRHYQISNEDEKINVASIHLKGFVTLLDGDIQVTS